MSLHTDAITEAEWQRTVVELAELSGYRVMHVRKSRVRDDRHATATSIPGWPDLYLFHPGRGEHFAAELKSQRGRLSADQTTCISELTSSGLTVYVWRPADWDAVQKRLRGGR